MKKLLFLLAVLATSPVRAADSLDNILACMKANIPDALRIQDIELSTSDRGGNTVSRLKGRLYAQRETAADGQKLIRAMLRVDEPQSFAGAAYLVRQNDDYLKDGMYVYLPSIRRVRRVTGTFADGALLGTNFSYTDFRQIQNSFGGATAALEGPDVFENRSVNILSFTPGKGEESLYGRVRTWVDTETCMPLKMEVYEDNAVRRRFIVPANAIQKSGRLWYFSLAQMEDLQEGTQTTMRILKVTTDQPLPKGYFDPETFWK